MKSALFRTHRPIPMTKRTNEPLTSDERFLPRYRIRRGADFQRAFDRRCAASDELLLVFGCENGLDYPRLGLSVSRKVGGAVRRNRWKRLLREAFRCRRDQLPAGIDLVVVPRPDAQPELSKLLESLPRIAWRIANKLKRDQP